MTIEDKIAGGLYGLLTGDALGVPYEFHDSSELPSYDKIEMIPPACFQRSHAGIEPGTWSDDGAQALCLLDSLLCCGKLSLEDFALRLSSWYQEGLWAVHGIVFDVGVQTGEALHAYFMGMPPEKCGFLRPEGKGNGALMRVLPLALWHRGTDRELAMDAHRQCLITHGHICNQVCCALYCLTARFLLQESGFDTAIEQAVASLRSIYRDMPEYEQELEWSIRPDVPWVGRGSGYVADCLRSAFMLSAQSCSYEDMVKKAVLLGNDTDTTACVAGGLAGIRFGRSGIPERWLHMLKEKKQVDGLLQRLESARCTSI